LSGILLALSFPNPLSVLIPRFPFGVLAWVALVPLLVSLEGKSPRESFRLGWLTGFTAFTGMLYWVIIAMNRYGGISFFISAIILVALTLYLSLYVGFFATLLPFIREKTGWSLSLVAPPLWIAMEYLRSVLLTGFPWENLGYSQYLIISVIQIADVTGVYGVSFLVLLVNALITSGFLQSRETGRVPLRIAIFLVLLLGVVITYGSFRVHQEERRISTQRPIRVAVVQGNIDQSLKWEPAYQAETVEIYSTLTHEVAARRPDLVIWPETALPFFFPIDQPLSSIVRKIPFEDSIYLLTGSPFYQEDENRVQYLNSAYLLSPEGEIVGRYDKIHLVPFGEYIPLSRFLPFIQPIAESIGDFVSGNETEGPVVFSIPEGRFGVLICYEIIFPGLNRRFVRGGADFLVTITNDAWFGRASAPFQHFSMATFRAVENRVFVARAANTGISGIIDSTGNILLQSEIFSRQALTGEVFMRNSETVYTRYGDVFAYACLLWGALLLGRASFMGKRKP
jgi:apolipoprotein N-acyltransferase